MLTPQLRAAAVALCCGGASSPAPAGAGRPTARCSSAAGSQLQIGTRGTIRFGRFVWIGDGTKIRCHEGEVVIGAKTVLGQECTISAYQHVRIGEQCVIADRAMFIDFDHGMVEVERPIRQQGIYKRDVDVGSNVWIGYGACILRGRPGRRQRDVGTNAVVTSGRARERGRRRRPGRGDPDARGAEDLRWPDPVEPEAVEPAAVADVKPRSRASSA